MEIVIDRRKISSTQEPYIIAELSGNHNKSLQRALDTITMAKNAGVHAVKIQTYTADTITIDSSKEDFIIDGGLWDGYRLYELYDWAHTPYEWHSYIFDHARKEGITCFSSPFDETAVDLLEDLNAPAYKIASFEAIDLPLIKYTAQTKKPLIISTGMANLFEIEEAVETARNSGCNELILLHCISSYPAPVEESNLRTISDLSKRFNVVSGLSDHSLGTNVAIAGVALGASVIEKHVTLSREDKGPDSEFSLEPKELEELCRHSLATWKALGVAGYDKKLSEEANLQFRRSIYFVKDIRAGDIITKDHIRRIRPGYGLHPKLENEIIGKQALKDIEAGTASSWNLISR